MANEMKQTKYILKRARNGKKRTKSASTALYQKERELIQKRANEFAQQFLGHRTMSVSAYINTIVLTKWKG